MECIKQYENAPYLNKGRGDGGFDCWGLVYAYYNDVLNIPVLSYDTDYDSWLDGSVVKLMIEESKKHWVRIDLKDAIDGDIILFNIMGKPRHVGILFGDRMLHIMVGCNVVYERYNTPQWKNRIAGVYRHDKRM